MQAHLKSLNKIVTRFEDLLGRFNRSVERKEFHEATLFLCSLFHLQGAFDTMLSMVGSLVSVEDLKRKQAQMTEKLSFAKLAIANQF
jgi:hypothetical protein